MRATVHKILLSMTVLSLALAAAPAMAKGKGNGNSHGSNSKSFSKSFHSSKSYCQPNYKWYGNYKCYTPSCWPQLGCNSYGCYDYGCYGSYYNSCYSPCYAPVIDVPLAVQPPLLRKAPVRISMHR